MTAAFMEHEGWWGHLPGLLNKQSRDRTRHARDPLGEVPVQGQELVRAPGHRQRRRGGKGWTGAVTGWSEAPRKSQLR